eukprot:COSAG01_NODE_9261_length_2500_cov_3.773844_1_plen_89_part_00
MDLGLGGPPRLAHRAEHAYTAAQRLTTAAVGWRRPSSRFSTGFPAGKPDGGAHARAGSQSRADPTAEKCIYARKVNQLYLDESSWSLP